MASFVLNGEREDVDDVLALSELLKEKNVKAEVVAVELNGEIIKRQKYNSTIINDGDILEIINYMGGG